MIKKRDSNVFTALLSALNVKHSKTFSTKYYNEHPYKYNLLGISRMLADYGVDNAGTRIKDKLNDIGNIETPFLADVGGDFAIIYKVTDEFVNYRINDLVLDVPKTKFCDTWSGVVLLAEPNSESAEPGYKKNYRKEILQLYLKITFILTTSIFLTIIFINNHNYLNIGILLSLVINILGTYIGYLLIQKELKIHSRYTDKICSLFKQSDCNSVLESYASKLWKVFSWSEIGFSYFLSNVIIINFLPQLINYYAIINIFALPYSIWSIWYQKNKAKQWCTLCLIVQILFWMMFIVNLIFGFIQIPMINISNLLLIGCIYGIPFSFINIIIPRLNESSKIGQITQEINSIKANEIIFSSLLKTQPHYEVEKSTSNIILGNPNANILVTILTNPHCTPCSKMHDRVEGIIKHTTHLCIQYIFSSFEESLNISNKFMIATYLNKGMEETQEIYAKWFDKGKFSKEDFFLKHTVTINDGAVEKEFLKHEAWIAKTGLRTTPTILVNGYKLPDNYKIEDLIYFSDLEVNSK